MVLIDTSVWIRFLADEEPYGEEVERLLTLDQVTGHDLVLGELLIGDRGGRRQFLATYESAHRTLTVPHRDVVDLVVARSLHGRGVGWIDIHLLASAIAGGHQLWTADTRFAVIAEEFGIAYRAPA
jgi:predicted nucleic acid-binding protein